LSRVQVRSFCTDASCARRTQASARGGSFRGCHRQRALGSRLASPETRSRAVGGARGCPLCWLKRAYSVPTRCTPALAIVPQFAVNAWHGRRGALRGYYDVGEIVLCDPCYKTGRMGSPQADARSTLMPRHAVGRVLQTTITAATSPQAYQKPGLRPPP